MKKEKKIRARIYSNKKWKAFSKKSIFALGGMCFKCSRTSNDTTFNGKEAVLQIHHTFYEEGLFPWDYELSDLEILCSGCHAREHGILEPSDGWLLLRIDDNGSPSLKCERQKTIKDNCNVEIRYEHLIYHPKVGYRIVGSTCILHLTKEDQQISKDSLSAGRSLCAKLNRLRNDDDLPSGWSVHAKGNTRFKTKKCLGEPGEYNIMANTYTQKGEVSSLSLIINDRKFKFKNEVSGKMYKSIYSNEFKLRSIVALADLIKKSRAIDKMYLVEIYLNFLRVLLKDIKWSIH